jgi:hypothetical protein
MFAGRLRSAALAVLVALAVPAAARATTSATATPDTMTASPTAVRDVLANDTDASGTAMSVTANTQPAHGSATCTALGACFYKANAGYTGSDTFTYTLHSVAGAAATGTVTVTVGASTAQAPLQARDDDVATLAGHALTVHVLANDDGTGLTVTSSGNPQHGTASCASNGTCTYTPAAGYTGSDGFVYHVSDSSSRTTSAAVHVLVAPASTAYALATHGAPVEGTSGAIPPGGHGAWGLSVTSGPAGITGQELGALGAPSATATLDGPHALTGGSLSTAHGWSVTQSGGALRFQAGAGALLGEGFTQVFPRPLPPISQGTGGDGHVPILVGSKVFAFFHHSHPTSVTCVDRATGTACPGYPKSLQFSTSDYDGFGTTDVNGPAVVVGQRIWTHLLTADGFAQSASTGLFCWDAATDSTCGLTIVDRAEQTGNPGASAPVLVDGKIWFGGDAGKLYCVDPSTGATCAPIATGQQAITTGEYYDVVAHGTRVFLARRGDTVSCIDVHARALCPGWATPRSFAGMWNVVNMHDATGAAVGVCVVYLSAGDCVKDATPATVATISNFVSKDPYSQGYSNTLEAETGTRTLVGSLGAGGLGCYDWSTMAPCTGGGYGSDGWITNETSGGASLPSAYGAAFDGGCVIALGDPGQVFTVDPAGVSPCTSLATGTDRTTIDLRDQRCDGTVGGAAWRAVRLTDTDAKEMESVTVTIRDAATGAVLKSGNLVGGDHTLDISGIDARQHPAITVDANAKSNSGNTPWDDGIPPRITVTWSGDPQQACFRTTGDNACGASPATVKVLGRLATPAALESDASLTLQRSPCGGVEGQHSRKCGGRRIFDIHLRFKGKDARRITVTIKGKKQRQLRMRPRPVFRVDLRKYSKGRIVVRITIVTKAGKKLHGTRVYHPCSAKRPGRGFRF